MSCCSQPFPSHPTHLFVVQPSFTAQARAPGATAVPFSSASYPSDVYTAPVQRPLLNALPRNMSAQQVKAAQQWTIFWRLVGFAVLPSVCAVVSIVLV
jgi:hypothetical protein